MEQKRKKMQLAYLVFFGLSTVFVGGYSFLVLESAQRRILLPVWVVLMALAYAFLELTWQRAMAQQMDVLLPLMHTDPDAYILRLNALIQGRYVERAFGDLRHINLGAAYCAKKDYITAKAEFLQANPRHLRGSYNRAVYWANLAVTLFYLEEKEAACAIMDKQDALFSLPGVQKGLGGVLAILDVFRLLSEGQRAEARKQLIAHRRRWSSPRFREDFDYLAAKTNEK